MRLALEPIALGYAVPLMTKVHFAQAEMMLSKLNWRFHQTLYAPCGRHMLMEMIEKLNRCASRAEIIALSIKERIKHSVIKYEKLLQACRDGDASKAKKSLSITWKRRASMP
ncbi:MAG: hypothetical protein COB78_00415 [Hyphomicrobiales bacterium]|nr:MAG: hypothetical protein COB78_00415 [Hyphomicrobiales bacterium]